MLLRAKNGVSCRCNRLCHIIADGVATWRIGLNYRKIAKGLNSERIRTYSSSRSSKVVDFGTNGKHIYHFLLVINRNYGPILHRFRDTATYWLKIAYFSCPSLIRRPRSLGSLWNFALRLSVRKLGTCGYLPVKIP